MRLVLVAMTAAALLALPAGSRADEQNVQSLIGQLRPRPAGQPIVTRGLPKAATPVATSAPAEPPAPAWVPPASVPSPAPAPAPVAVFAPASVPVAAAADAPSADLNVLFATGSAELTPQAVQLLSDLGRALTDASMGESHFLIEGHTDTVGDHAANQSLSERRAAAVVNYLVTRFHIPAERLTAKGVGEDALLVQTPDQTPEPRNRRVHVVNLNG